MFFVLELTCSINTCLANNLKTKEIKDRKELIKNKIDKLSYCNGNTGNTVITESFYKIAFNRFDLIKRKFIKVNNISDTIVKKELLINESILLNLQDCIKIEPYLNKEEFDFTRF